MSTRMLNVCGLYLGEETDLLPPAPDNPDGFWENSRIVEINEDLLSMLGGAWDCPPVFPMELDERFARAYAKAEITLEMFADREPWGWKDPRNSLTLPFWRQYFPDMKIVICLRNPLEVAQSLYRRSWYSYELSMTLWYTYNQRLLRAIPREQRIITHYDAYFADPEGELRRVLDFLGLSAADKRIVQACSTVSRGLRHHRFTTQQMLDVGVTPAVFDLYTAMCIEAGMMSEDVSSGNGDDPSGGTTRSLIERDADDEARNRLVWRLPVMEDVFVRTEKQPGLTSIGVGRLDRSAVDAIVLKEEVHMLQAVISDAHDAHGKLQEVVHGTEQSLLTLTEAHKQRGAYVETLEQQAIARAASDEETRSYVETLEQRLRVLAKAQEQRGTYVETLEQRLLMLAEEHERRGVYVETLEQQGIARAASDEETRSYVETLEQRLLILEEAQKQRGVYVEILAQHFRALAEEHERRGAYVETLEQQAIARAASDEETRSYIRGLEEHIAAVHAQDREIQAYTRALEQQISASGEELQRFAAYIHTLENERITAQALHQRDAIVSPQTRLRMGAIRIWKRLRNKNRLSARRDGAARNV